MNPQWQDYLQADGALLENDVVRGFTALHEAEPAVGRLTALIDMGVINVSGEDAATFLQAHFCNDVMNVTQELPQLSGYCSPKGRLLAIFYLARQADDYLLVLPREVLESVLKRLNMFAQMARPAGKQMMAPVTKTSVSLTDTSDEQVVIAFESDQQNGLSDKVLKDNPELKLIPVLTEPGSPQRYLCIATVDAGIALWEKLKPISLRVPTDAWRLSDIRAGSPTVVCDTQETFVPQMTNMHLVQGVSFTKGCYPGQEIVARMQYLGTLKRRMERFRVDLTGVQAGAEISSSKDAVAGVVVQAAPTGPEAPDSELLAVMKISALEDQTLFLGGQDGVPLERLSMPYSLEAETASGPSSDPSSDPSSATKGNPPELS